MRFPQVSDRVKEAPAQALRGVFAGIGQLLLFTDKLRNKAPAGQRRPAAGAPQPASAGAPPPAPATGPPLAGAAPPAPAATHPDQPGPAAEPAADPGPPLPNYDELSVASLRARLRNLDVAQLRQLISYEQAHANRAAVIAMYRRRLAKLEDERRADEDGEAAAEAEIEARAEAEDAVRTGIEAGAEGED
jgi:hypothetical protein